MRPMRLHPGDRLLVTRHGAEVFLSLLENPTGREVMVILTQDEQARL